MDGYDASWSIVWGDSLRHLDAPDFGSPLAPTPHPLANVVGALASIFGTHAGGLLIALSFLSYGALGVAAVEVGRRSFGAVAGVAFAAILLTRPLVITETLEASIDVPFLALVVTALAMELARERRGAPVLAVLGVAGLLRPEAWLLSAAYVAYAAYGRPRRECLRLVLVAAAAPVAWLGWDLLLTGDPLFSLTGTQNLAEQLGRDRGLGNALHNTPVGMRVILGSAVAWAGVGCAAVALFAAQERARAAMALLGVSLAGFLGLGVADLPLLLRYLLVPATMLALFAAAGLTAFSWLPGGSLRRPVAAAALVAVVVCLAVEAPGSRDAIQDARRGTRAARAVDQSLERVARAAPAGCRPVQVTTYRGVPVLAHALGLKPSEVRVAPPSRASSGVVFAAAPEALAADIAITPVSARDLRLPRGFAAVARERLWSAGARCAPAPRPR